MFRLKQYGMACIVVAACLRVAGAQAPSAPKAGVETGRVVSLALTYDASTTALTSTNRFWMQGGGAEVSASIYHGLGFGGSVLGLHASNSGGGVPVNLIVVGFGPRYTYTTRIHKRRVAAFGQALVGEANGFQGVYPEKAGADVGSNSLAVQFGGGVDVEMTPHVSIRAVQADWLRTQLPNGANNSQNSVRVGVGIVFHTRPK